MGSYATEHNSDRCMISNYCTLLDQLYSFGKYASRITGGKNSWKGMHN